MNFNKIDETISALKICSLNNQDEIPTCPICPYYGIANVCCECLMRDAAELMERMKIEILSQQC